jgi:hypothetical protein
MVALSVATSPAIRIAEWAGGLLRGARSRDGSSPSLLGVLLEQVVELCEHAALAGRRSLASLLQPSDEIAIRRLGAHDVPL